MTLKRNHDKDREILFIVIRQASFIHYKSFNLKKTLSYFSININASENPQSQNNERFDCRISIHSSKHSTVIPA